MNGPLVDNGPLSDHEMGLPCGWNAAADYESMPYSRRRLCKWCGSSPA